MSLEADAIVDRRRTRRKLVFWRVSAFVLLAAALLAAAGAAGALKGLDGAATPHIARITISGVIMEDRAQLEMIERVAESDAVEGVILAIDSPGGTTTGGEALYEAVLKLAEVKPVVASVQTLAASAGYMVAIATDHIVARRSSITGSIGVLFQYGNVSRLLDNIGISVNTIKSAPLKAEPNPFSSEEPPGTREAIAALVDDTYQWFVDIVAEQRGFDRAEALRLADGRVFSGRQALDAKLIDEIGGEEAAIAWLAEEYDVDPELPVRDWEPKRADEGFSFAEAALGAVGGLIGRDLGALVPTGASLDGLVSVWQGQLSDDEDVFSGGRK
ncbi:signal peptide peptidase SppA [Methylobrevis albus]|uniref:Signal peptide peptidase SppA n=1 Tax=Methylobrevis albus TaxID=2793297 RepID=A0A931I2G4_9HYPH|nr:signal peptide peptidase SppA [Methylobrevis albus]MBH0238083.1 signal peptide peptidase SppA [Methylobrevis albus]